MRLQGAKMILDWNDAMMKTSHYDVDPMWTVMREGGPEHCRGQLKDYMKRLEGTPREYGIELLKEKYQAFDARVKYGMPKMEGRSNPACRCGDVLQGKCRPSDCKVFGTACTPQHPIGACMVSNEGSCSAYYQYGMDQ